MPATLVRTVSWRGEGEYHDQHGYTQHGLMCDDTVRIANAKPKPLSLLTLIPYILIMSDGERGIRYQLYL